MISISLLFTPTLKSAFSSLLSNHLLLTMIPSISGITYVANHRLLVMTDVCTSSLSYAHTLRFLCLCEITTSSIVAISDLKICFRLSALFSLITYPLLSHSLLFTPTLQICFLISGLLHLTPLLFTPNRDSLNFCSRLSALSCS